MMIQSLDVSHVAHPRVIRKEEFAPFVADGIRMLVLGLHGGVTVNRWARDTLQNAREAGMVTAGYIYLAPGAARHQVDQAVRWAGDEWAQLRFVAVDVEWDPKWIPPALTTNDVWEALTAIEAAGQCQVLYFPHWYWYGYMGQPRGFADIPLWESLYTGVPTLTMARLYGGWTKRAGHQYQGSTLLHNLTVDLNVFDDSLITRVRSEPMVLTDAQRIMAATKLWDPAPFVPEHGIPASWLREWVVGRYRGKPLGPERLIDGESIYQEFEHGLVVYRNGHGASWTG